VRKVEINKHKAQRFIAALRAGNTRAAACLHAGFAGRTVRRWLEDGAAHAAAMEEDPTLKPTEQSRLWEAVQMAEGGVEVQMTALILNHAKTTWQAAAWWLERRRPQDYGKAERIISAPPEEEVEEVIIGGAEGDG
jgi:hypothetical protein